MKKLSVQLMLCLGTLISICSCEEGGHEPAADPLSFTVIVDGITDCSVKCTAEVPSGEVSSAYLLVMEKNKVSLDLFDHELLFKTAKELGTSISIPCKDYIINELFSNTTYILILAAEDKNYPNQKLGRFKEFTTFPKEGDYVIDGSNNGGSIDENVW